MERVLTNGIIYKVSKYADNSAIALAYTYDYGKIKLFMPKAYSSKSGIHPLIPGEIDFLKKDTSDLNKFYNFQPNKQYLNYPTTPAISLRLGLYFDIFDKLYELEQADSVIWTILQKYSSSNYSKINLFSIYALLKNTGHMFNFRVCDECGKEAKNKAGLYNGLYYCEKCMPQGAFIIDSYTQKVLNAFSNKTLYNNMEIDIYKELSVLDLFIYHIKTITGDFLKSYKLFKEMIVVM